MGFPHDQRSRIGYGRHAGFGDNPQVMPIQARANGFTDQRCVRTLADIEKDGFIDIFAGQDLFDEPTCRANVLYGKILQRSHRFPYFFRKHVPVLRLGDKTRQ